MMNKQQINERVQELFIRNKSNKVWALENAEFWQDRANKCSLKGAKKNMQMWADAFRALAS